MQAAENGESISLGRYRDLSGRSHGPWVRRVVVLLVFGTIVAMALLNVFGQHTSNSSIDTPAASLSVSAPKRLRGGLLYQATFRITAHRALAKPKLALAKGWFASMTLNTSVPDPASQQSRGDGVVVFSFDPLDAGESIVERLQSQVNPTNVGNGSQDVELDDGTSRLAVLHRGLTVFP